MRNDDTGLLADRSDFDLVSDMAETDRKALVRLLGGAGLVRLAEAWEHRARPAQLPPPGDWRVWLVMAGRGYGKTRMGAEWVRSIAEQDGSARIALIGASRSDARSVMVEGESGLLSIAPAHLRPDWQPSLRRLRWPSGAVASVYGATHPDALRGPQHSHVWADEIAKWMHGLATWDNAMMGLRLGAQPRALATTTPRPVALLRRLLAQDGVVVTRGRTVENRAALPFDFLAAMHRDYAGSRLGRQELDGELLSDLEGALWTRDTLEACRVHAIEGDPRQPTSLLRRVVIGVDPPASSNGDGCGIVVAGIDAEGRAYVLEDASIDRPAPDQWARRVADALRRWRADRIIAEANNGGAMVEAVLRAAELDAPVRLVHASRGKVARAEPVSALYQAGRVRHAGLFARLEDEMCGMLTAGGYAGPGRSPDRADALVWALTELMLRRAGTPKFHLA